MKYLTLALLTLALAGCATTGHFENRITRTLACDRIFVASLYGPVGITTEIDKKDVAELCKKP